MTRRAVLHRRPRGTTLIEMMIVLVIAFLISALALQALLEVKRVQDEANVRNQMFRDVQLAIDHIGHDLNYVGLGVPAGLAAVAEQSSLSAAFTDQMRPVVRRAKAGSFAMVGDLPYPNAELPGIMNVAAVATSGNPHKVTLTSELSPCVPARSGAAAGYTCDPEDPESVFASRVPSDYGGADRCTESTLWPNPARLCPWGQNKWQPGSNSKVQFVLGAPDGTWYVLRWPRVTSSSSSNYTDEENGIALHLDHDHPGSNEHDLDADLVINSSGAGSAWVSQLDRVFYLLDSGTLYRRQCWGAVWSSSVVAGDTSWPDVGDTALTLATNPAFCSVPDEGTGWEPVVSNLTSLSFTYRDRDDAVVDVAALTPEEAASIRTVEVDVRLERTNTPALGRTVSTSLRRRFHLQNAYGIVGAPAAAGGCDGVTCQ